MSGPSALQTPLCDLLGIRHALLLAGMARRSEHAELVSEVSRSGGLGVLGVSGMTVDAVARATPGRDRARGRRPGGRERPARRAQSGDGRPRTHRRRARAVPGRARTAGRERPAARGRLAARAARDGDRSRGLRGHDVRGPDPGRRARAPRRHPPARHGDLARRRAARGGRRCERRHRAGHGVRRSPQRVRSRRQRRAPGGRHPRARAADRRCARRQRSGDRKRRHHGRPGHRRGTRARRHRRLARHALPRRARERCGRVLPARRRRMPGGRHGRDRCPDRASGALDPQSLRGCRGRGTRGHPRLGDQAAAIADIRRAAAAQERSDILPMLAGQAAALAGEPQPAAAIVELLLEQTQAACA